MHVSCRSKCFICGLKRTEFERASKDFRQHQTSEHNVLHYLYFIIHLREKDPSEYTGAEQYICEKLAADDVSFFPIGMSMSLRSKGLSRPPADVLLKKQVERLAAAVSDAHRQLLRKMLDLEQCRKLKAEHAPANLRTLLLAAERARRASVGVVDR